MGLLQTRQFLLLVLLNSLLLLSLQAKASDEEDTLLEGINNYRTSLNLSTLIKVNNAECFAGELSDQFKNQPCTNSTGANTVPGTEPRFLNYPKLLSKCHLDLAVTKDGQIMPVCVPQLVPDVVLANYTQSQYSQYLNDSKYTGIGISSEDDWIVVVLTSNTPGGSFSPATPSPDGSGSAFFGVGFVQNLVPMLFGIILVLF